MINKIISSRLYIKLTYLVLSLFLLLSSCFPGTNWPYYGEKINMPLVKVLDELYKKDNIKGWQENQEVKDIIRDYTLTVNTILNEYYKPIKLQDLQDVSIKAILAKWKTGERSSIELYEEALDKVFVPLQDRYSRYMNAEEFAQYNDNNQNKLRGIGIFIEKVKLGLKIVSFIKGSALEGLNIPEGAIITAVDGIDISKMELRSSQKLLLGKVGTKVSVTFFEPKTKNNYTYVVTRRLILIDSITSKLVTKKNNRILYINIRNFNGRSSALFKEILINNYQNAKNPPIGILINLKNNPGGLVNEVVSMVDWLLDEGMILRIAYKKDDVIYNAKLQDLVPERIPVVILTNKFSASASEIFAGSLQSSKRAVVIGTKSFGKTVVQRTFELSNGRGFKTTIGRYFVFGNIYLDKGITPNYSVKNNPNKEGDEILQAGYNYIIKESQKNSHTSKETSKATIN